MSPTASRRAKQWRNWFRLHIDLSTVVILLLLVLLVHQPLAYVLALLLESFQSKFPLSTMAGQFIVSMSANVITAVLLGVVVVLILKLRWKKALVGEFAAFIVQDDGTEEPWGHVTLTYNLFTARLRGQLKHDGIIVDIDAVFDRSQYLRGHYYERGKLARRRLGAFLFLLDGEGENYHGKYVYVAPDDDDFRPQIGTAIWKRTD